MNNLTGELAYTGDDVCPVCGAEFDMKHPVELELDWHDGSVGLVYECPRGKIRWDNVYNYGHSYIFTDGLYEEAMREQRLADHKARIDKMLSAIDTVCGECPYTMDDNGNGELCDQSMASQLASTNRKEYEHERNSANSRG